MLGFVSQVQRSPTFRRDGPDIHSDVMISVAQAILGGTARAQGLYGTVDIAVRRVHAQHTPYSNLVVLTSEICTVRQNIPLKFGSFSTTGIRMYTLRNCKMVHLDVVFYFLYLSRCSDEYSH